MYLSIYLSFYTVYLSSIYVSMYLFVDECMLCMLLRCLLSFFLCVQGLLRLLESDVVIRCREMDKDLVEGLLPSAAKRYSQIMRDEAGINKTVKVTLDKSGRYLPPPPSSDNPGMSWYAAPTTTTLSPSITYLSSFYALTCLLSIYITIFLSAFGLPIFILSVYLSPIYLSIYLQSVCLRIHLRRLYLSVVSRFSFLSRCYPYLSVSCSYLHSL